MGIFKFDSDEEHIDACYLRIDSNGTLYARKSTVVCIRMADGGVTWDKEDTHVELYIGEDE